ncbi:hypothetical protein KKH82_05995 [Patescibacteria group bacterium]|nr:hypothetical protein [Patescibacteria group bacterium]
MSEKSLVEVSIEDNTIILEHDGNKMETIRDSGEGIVLESMLNYKNGEEVREELLSLAVENKAPVPYFNKKQMKWLIKVLGLDKK